MKGEDWQLLKNCNFRQWIFRPQRLCSIRVSRNFVCYRLCNLLPVIIYVTFRHADPDDAAMKDVKKVLSDNNIDFSQLMEWNAKRSQKFSFLPVVWWKRDDYKIGLLADGTHCTAVWFNANRCQELSVGWWKRDDYKVGLLVEETHCTVVWFIGYYENDVVLFISKIN